MRKAAASYIHYQQQKTINILNQNINCGILTNNLIK